MPTEMQYLLQQLEAAFVTGPPPNREVVFQDPDELEYYKAWDLPLWTELRADDAAVYVYMSAPGRMYYIPGLVTLLIRGEGLGESGEEMMINLAAPDYPSSRERAELWKMLQGINHA